MAVRLRKEFAVNQPKGTKNESNSQLTNAKTNEANAVNQPKGTKNESNSQRLVPRGERVKAVNQPKGTKNESNSQPNGWHLAGRACCKSTQRYKERKQFTT